MPHPDIRRYLKHGTLPQLRALEAVARLGSVSRAADELHMAQPTASVQVKKLTETVGLPLLEATGSQLRPTDAGERVLAGCARLFRVLAEMEEALSEIRGAASGSFSLAAPTAARPFATRLLELFLQRNRGIQASLKFHDRTELIERLRRTEDDLYMFVEPPDGRDVVAQAIVANPLVVFARADHPLAGAQDIPFARLAAEPFVMREPGCGTRLIVMRLFAARGLAPRIRMELTSDEAVREAVLAGLGVSILPRYALGLDPLLTKLICLDADGFPLESHWHFVYPVGKRLGAAARAFMDFGRAEAKSLFRDCLRAADGAHRRQPEARALEAG